MNSYPYVNGTIKSLENRLLNRTKISRMSLSGNDNFVKNLYDAGFGEESTELEGLIRSEEEKTKKLLIESSPNPFITSMFFASEDARTLKIVYKEKLFSCNLINYKSSGAYDKEEVEKLVNKNIPSSNKALNDIVAKINGALSENVTARELSAIIDRNIYQYALEKSKHFRALTTYYKAKIDFTNILSFVRARLIHFEVEDLKKILISGGKIDCEIFINHFGDPDEQLINMLKNTSYGKLDQVINKFIETKNLNNLEHDFQQMVLNIMQEFKNDSFDIGPIIYYYLEKEAEIENIRECFAYPGKDISMLLTY